MNATRRTVSAASAAALSLIFSLILAPASLAAQDAVTVIRASSVIDGRGKTLSNVDITMVHGKITKIGPSGATAPAGARLIDLRGRTVLPGLIDAHSHLTW